MKELFFILALVGGIFIALILNNLFTNKIEDKSKRIGLKITSFFLCIFLGVSFVFISTLRNTLDVFIEDKIIFIENSLIKAFPNENILELNINTNELTLISNEINKITDNLESVSDGLFEQILYNAFLKKYANYIYTVQNGLDTLTSMSDDNGEVTIKSILLNLKNILLNTISPYFVIGHILILLLLFAYIGIIVFLNKGGAMYNKSIVYGEIEYTDTIKRKAE